MCQLCDEGQPRLHDRSELGRRDFLKASAGTAAGAAAMGLFAPRRAEARDDDQPPRDNGRHGRRYVIRGGHVMTMDPARGDYVKADVLVEGKRIREVAPHIHAPGAGEIDARGRIVMPGFIDTHHHLFETAIRSYLTNGILIDDGTPDGDINYFQYILLTFAPVYRPGDVYISELFGSLSSLDAGVTTVHDISQIHHSPEHSDAAIQGLQDSDRRAVLGYFEGAGFTHGPDYAYPADARRIKRQYFSSSDQLLTMIMGGEIYLPGFGAAWAIGRELGLPIAAHIVGSFGMRPTFDDLAANDRFGSDNLFIHMTGMSDTAWEAVKEAGAHVSLAVPIEMNMRHGTPPILKTLGLGIQPSLSTDVEVTLTADMFTQMRSTMNLQRALVNQMVFDSNPGAAYPLPPAGTPPLLRTQDVLRYATMEGAKGLRLDHKVGSLTPGKEADIIILDAEAINVAPLNNVPGAVVALMERSNVETVIVAGKVRKWKGKLLDVDLRKLRRELEASRDYLYDAAGIPQDLYRPN
jgi:cytosine/adenosine deaminase-related metal-dependent hydrolase